MRNRGVEISIIMPHDIHACHKLDIRSLLNNCGLKKVNQQNLLLRVHENVYGGEVKLNELLQAASFTSQQVTKGFAFEKSLKNSYREACGMFNWKARREASRKIDEILSGDSEEESFRYDLDDVTLRICDLRRNSELAVVKQQGFLLKSAVEMLRWGSIL